MTDEEAAARIARGAGPADIVARREAARGAAGSPASGTAAPYDPLKLCIYATIALLGWLLGPVALAVFAVIGFAGYWTAWRAGLTRSRCWLRDTRLVLLYLGLLAVAGAVGSVLWAVSLIA